jgi:metal-responsive CopG/Arc/MetJ family transcriptional regulator
MPLRKTAITVPADVLRGVDLAAKQRGESRSAFVSRVLALALKARHDREVTRRLDKLFADARTAHAQRRQAEDLDRAGSAWADEDW